MATQTDATKTFYGDQFTPEELALLAAFVADPTLDDEIRLRRVLAGRMGDAVLYADGATLAKGGAALTAGSRRIARRAKVTG